MRWAPKPRRRISPACTADGAHCIAPVSYTRDVCRTIEALAGGDRVTAYLIHKEERIVTEEEMRVAGFTPPPPAKPVPVAAPKPIVNNSGGIGTKIFTLFNRLDSDF